MATRLPREPLNQRPVQQPTHDRDHEHEEDPERRQVQARRMALLAELLIAGRDPREREDHLPEHGSAQARAGADEQRHHRQPEPFTTQPRRHRPEQRRAKDPSRG